MRKKMLYPFSSLVIPVTRFACLVLVVFCMESCGCVILCEVTQTVRSVVQKNRDIIHDCDSYCGVKQPDYQTAATKSPGDSVAGYGNPIPEKEPAGVATKKLLGEHMSNVITVGPTLSFMNSTGDLTYEGQTQKPGIGVQVGFGTSLPMTRNFSLAPTLRVKQLSASERLSYSSPGSPGYESITTSSYNYLGGNLLAQFQVSNGLSVLAGPEITYLLSASSKDGGRNGSGEKQKITGDSQKGGVDLVAGFKYEIPAAGNKWSKWGLSLTYDHRLSRVNKKQTDGYDAPALKMKSVQLGVAYFWKKRHK